MSEQASHIAREAKGLQQGLKESLRTRDPWDKEVEFQRKNLRRQYLRLILVHPYAKESKDAETHLWMQTSYAFISVYKQRLAVLDRALHSAPRQQQQQGRQSGHGPVEYRKLMQRFRQFLADEDKFWTQLLVRFRRSFCLDEAQSALVTLGILPSTDDSTGRIPDVSDPPKDGLTPVTTGRNHFQFPPEDPTTSVAPQTPADRDGRLTILSKALVCLGDIARYRELYNESGGRPRAGYEENMHAGRKNPRNKRGDPSGLQVLPRARNYEKAQQCYEQARLLVPYEGNPSHQLAILASYQKDTFGSLYHYYRALCVRQPYDTASENLGTVLSKALEQWKARTRREREKPIDKDGDRGTGTSLAPRLRVEAFKEAVVVLNALWRLGDEKMDSTSPKHAERVRHEFVSLVSDRVLPIDTISKAVILVQGALWKHRMIRDPVQSKKPDHAPLTSASIAVIESRILIHLLGLHQALLEAGLVQLAEAPPEDAAAGDLAQRITATFRRTLPALRISSKWLRANFKYVVQRQQSDESTAHELDMFWVTYSRFSNALSHVFSVERLPVMSSPLDEDVEMRGFLPLRKLMAGDARIDGKGDGSGPSKDPIGRTQVHPNEEQLMRISDLLDDAKALAAMKDSPFSRQTNVSAQAPVVHAEVPLVRQPSTDPKLPGDLDSEEDAMTEATSRTDDDPVRDAFRLALDGDISSGDAEEEDDQEDEIVWDPRASMSPVRPGVVAALPSSPTSRLSPTSPIRPNFSPPGSLNLTPTHSRVPTHVKGRSPLSPTPAASIATTAQDLLNNVMGVPRTGTVDATRVHSNQQSSAPQPQLLFGSGPPNLPGHSIWSTSLDDNSFNFQERSPGHHASHSYQAPPQHFSGSPPSIWSSSYPSSAQNSLNPLPLSSYPTQPLPNGGSGHQRASSAQVSVPHLFGNESRRPNHDHFGYSMTQSVIQRPIGERNHGPALYTDPATIYGAQEIHYAHTSPSAYHHHHHHHHSHDPRIGSFVPQPISQVWGSTG